MLRLTALAGSLIYQLTFGDVVQYEVQLPQTTTLQVQS